MNFLREPQQRNTDYMATNSQLVFAPGTTEIRIGVTIVGDTDIEENETFLLTLSNEYECYNQRQYRNGNNSRR